MKLKYIGRSDTECQKRLLQTPQEVDHGLYRSPYAIAAEALGPENVIAVNMPYRLSQPESRAHAQAVAERIHATFCVINVTSMIDAYFDRLPDSDEVRKENKLSSGADVHPL